MPQRRNLVWMAALLTLILVAWTAWRDAGNAVSEASTPRRQALPAAPPTLAVAAPAEAAGAGSAAENPALDRDPIIEASTDPFKAVSFLPPPPKAVAVVPPPVPPAPKPVAPAFPYKYFGRIVGIVGIDGKTQTYLSRGDALVAVRERDVLDQVYRIDTIGATQIGVTYLPLDEKN